VALFINQPNYSILNRWIEPELLATFDALATERIAFSPLAQGMLTSKYLGGIRPTHAPAEAVRWPRML